SRVLRVRLARTAAAGGGRVQGPVCRPRHLRAHPPRWAAPPADFPRSRDREILDADYPPCRPLTGHLASANSERGRRMAAMKPRTGDGPLEVTKEGRDIVMRMPLDGGGRLVVEMTPDEANALGDALKSIAG